MLKKGKSLPIGLDISDYTLKMIQLKKAGDKLRMQAFGRLPVESGVIDNGEVKDRDKFAASVKKLIAKPLYGSITTDEVVTCLPETRTFIKLIEIEKSPNAIEAVIENEIQKHVPMALKDIYYDWQAIAQDETSHHVQIGAAPKAIVEDYAGLLKSCGLFVRALEIESQAISRAVLHEESRLFNGPKTANYCIIDVGALRSNLVIYSRGAIVMSIHMPISGQAVTEKIAKSLEIKAEQAEKAKLICGLDKSQAHGIVAEIITGMVDELVDKISTAFDYYGGHFEGRGPIDRVLLCGGGANIKGLDQRISDSLKTPCAVADVLIHLSDDKPKVLAAMAGKEEDGRLRDFPQNYSLSYTSAIGLALRLALIDKE